MSFITLRPGTLLSPVPAALIGSGAEEESGLVQNLMTAAWAGTVCSDPPMVSVSIRPSRYTYELVEKSGEFTVNLTDRGLLKAADYCGVRSGRDVDKWKETGLTPEKAQAVSVPLIAESPVNIECRVKDVLKLGSHHMFLAEVLAVDVDESLLDMGGRLALEKAEPVVYSHGEYYGLSELMGTFGWSVRKKKRGVHGKKNG